MSFSLKRHSVRKSQPPQITDVSFADGKFVATFADGRRAEVSLKMFPRLSHGSPWERNHWELIGPGTGIHWPDLDEDISAENILEQKPSLEGERSFRRWLARRAVRQGSL